MSWQGQAKQPIMLRGRSVSAGVPDAPGPSPWISQASRAGLRCCVVVVDVFGQLSAAMWQARLVGTAAWRFGPTHVCQGVGCRYCDVSVPGDGRGSRGRTLGPFMANPAFRPDSEGRTLKDNDIIQGFFTWSGPDPDCRTRKLGTSDRHPSLDLGSPFRTLVGCVSL